MLIASVNISISLRRECLAVGDSQFANKLYDIFKTAQPLKAEAVFFFTIIYVAAVESACIPKASDCPDTQGRGKSEHYEEKRPQL